MPAVEKVVFTHCSQEHGACHARQDPTRSSRVPRELRGWGRGQGPSLWFLREERAQDWLEWVTPAGSGHRLSLTVWYSALGDKGRWTVAQGVRAHGGGVGEGSGWVGLRLKGALLGEWLTRPRNLLAPKGHSIQMQKHQNAENKDTATTGTTAQEGRAAPTGLCGTEMNEALSSHGDLG